MMVNQIIALATRTLIAPPNLVLKVDFGESIGIKQSSAQITHYYKKESLIWKQVVGICNFPTKNIAGIVSEVLILGVIEKDGKVVLLHPSQKAENGLEINYVIFFIIFCFKNIWWYNAAVTWSETSAIKIKLLISWRL